jgi:hypothetical protein
VTPRQIAETIIESFSIRDPRDLDVEAISIDSGMRVVYRPLTGCAATLVGRGNRAIATISPSGSLGRDRFSIGHELGHWSMHRGQTFVCRAEDFGANTATKKAREKEADTFAAHLLMPTTLMRSAIGSLRVLSFSHLEQISTDFQTSVAATAFRITHMDNFPTILCCYSAEGLKWSIRATMVPNRWRLKTFLDEDSFAHDLLHNGARQTCPGKQSAEAWFANQNADEYEVMEECLPYLPGQALVLLHLTDEGMLETGYDPDVWTEQRR